MNTTLTFIFHNKQAKMMNTIEIHRKQPNITLAQHIQNKRLQLGKEISKKYKIYLDLRFWFF